MKLTGSLPLRIAALVALGIVLALVIAFALVILPQIWGPHEMPGLPGS